MLVKGATGSTRREILEVQSQISSQLPIYLVRHQVRYLHKLVLIDQKQQVVYVVYQEMHNATVPMSSPCFVCID